MATPTPNTPPDASAGVELVEFDGLMKNKRQHSREAVRWGADYLLQTMGANTASSPPREEVFHAPRSQIWWGQTRSGDGAELGEGHFLDADGLPSGSGGSGIE